MRISLLLSCVVWVIICLIVSGLSGWISASHVAGWYTTIQQPSFNPPNWLFGPVWTILYIMLGIVGGLLWHKRSKYPVLFLLFCLQLLCNFAWSFIFFVGHNITWAFIDIIAMWFFVLLLMVQASKCYKTITWLLVPYFLWISFAAMLNASLMYLN